MGKMAKTSFNEYVERASDLLKIIDINVEKIPYLTSA
jgi:hypothetical protein